MSKNKLLICKIEGCPMAKRNISNLRKHLTQYHGYSRAKTELLLEKWGYTDREDPDRITTIKIKELRDLSRKALDG